MRELFSRFVSTVRSPLQSGAPKGCIDRIVVGRSRMLVEGWLLLEPSAKTDRAVFANGIPVEGDWVDVFREDLLKAGLGNGHSGFRVIAPIEPFRDPKTGAITAPQVGLRTSRKRIRTAKHTFALQEPRGGLDGIADGVLMGWVDTSNLAPNVQPNLTLNGTPVYPVQPNMPRPDVVAAGMAFDEMVGFAVPVSAILAADSNPPFQSASPSLDNRLSIGLVVDGQALGHTDLEFSEGIAARIESYTDGLLTGWAVRSWRIARPMEVDILVDGLRYATVRPGRQRSDLRQNYPSHDGGGFECRIPYSPTGKPSFDITIAIRGQEVELGPKATISVDDVAVRPKSLERALPYLRGRKADNGVAIIIPIHNAVDDVRACLTSLVEYTTGHASCLLPGFDGATLSQDWKDALCDKLFTGAPRRRRRSVERYKIVKRA